MFFSFDGVDGVGKTTQIKRFAQWLSADGYQVTSCRDPGSTPLGESIRQILLSLDQGPISTRSEMLLYMAARAQLVEERIFPALDAGQVVVSDRYLLANVVYQGYAGGLNPETLWQVGAIATCGLQPDLTFLLDMPPEQATLRIGRELDRMESKDPHYRLKLREGFLTEARRHADRIVVIDASQSIEQVHADVCAAAAKMLQWAAK
ncbi:MAG: dTMP kinase [Pirellulales bacterium]